MKKLRGAVFALLILATSQSGFADGVGVGLKAGTPGLGVELTKSIGRSVNLRLGFNTFTVEYDANESDIDYHFQAELRSVVALLDWHPGGGAFRLSAGGLRNRTALKGLGTPTGFYTIGDTLYSPAEVGDLRLLVDVPNLAPYAGLGFGNTARGGRLHFTMDLGVIFQGSPEASLTANGPVASTPGFREDAQAEVIDLNSDLRRFRYYPVFAVGIAVRF